MSLFSSDFCWRLGLTGGIGSGKSTVAAMLADEGAHVVDADAISRSVTAPGGLAMTAIRQQFGPEALAADGGLNRQVMRDWVFADAGARARLEAIVHPLVLKLVDERMDAAARAGAHTVVFDMPLLVEGGARWRQRLDHVAVVDCEVDTQRMRVKQRNGLDDAQIDAILAAQATRAERLAAADAVIHNGAGVDLSRLRAQAQQLMRWRGQGAWPLPV